jgi:hypothetical protein
VSRRVFRTSGEVKPPKNLVPLSELGPIYLTDTPETWRFLEVEQRALREAGIDPYKKRAVEAQESDVPLTIIAHIHWKLDEAQFFLEHLTSTSEALFRGIRPLGYEWTDPSQNQGFGAFLFLLSGFLSAVQCVENYMKEFCKRRTRWYSKVVRRAIRNRSVLATLRVLRNSDVHEKTLSMSGGVTHVVRLNEGHTSSEFTWDEIELRSIPMLKLKENEWMVKVLLDRTILALARDGFAELRSVVEEGIELGHLV